MTYNMNSSRTKASSSPNQIPKIIVAAEINSAEANRILLGSFKFCIIALSTCFGSHFLRRFLLSLAFRFFFSAR